MEDIRIKYDGAYPNLCSGHLEVYIDNKLYDFGKYCLCSGGGVYHNEDWDMWTESGEWSIEDWPEDFPEDMKDAVLKIINEEIPWGCCGGCI